MTTREKIALCSGRSCWNTKNADDIESISMSDGPHGLRCQNGNSDRLGINNSNPATCFPTASITACSWDDDVIYDMAQAIGDEASHQGVDVVLGPGVNIKRNPLCGRNFEYFSEDPYLAGKLASAYIRGMQDTATGCSLKHFALNSQEYKRMCSDSIADERTMREIYLRAFEIAVREAHPWTVMCSYNKINGVHASDDRKLLTDILRKEWGFDGVVVTDWGAMCDRIRGFEAGCDLAMPGGSAYQEKKALEAVESGKLDEKYIDESVERIRRLSEKCRHRDPDGNFRGHHDVAVRTAQNSIVLLRNEDGILPLDRRHKDRILFVGSMAENMRYQGSGSSHINAIELVSPCGCEPDIAYIRGCDDDGTCSLEQTEEIRANAGKYESAVVFAGLTDLYESEGFDRENMKMPQGHLDMIDAVCSVNPNVIVVLMCGSPIEIPFGDKVKGIIYAGLAGEGAGEAICSILFGDVCPSGHLAETWPESYEDCVTRSCYPMRDAHYREGIYAGYRYYQKAGVSVRYPFGYGLSYAEFEYSDIESDGKHASFTVTNVSDTAGSAVCQLYVRNHDDSYREIRSLAGYRKVFLKPGEKRRVTVDIDERAFMIWNDGFVTIGGSYDIEIGESCENIVLKKTVGIEGEAMPEFSLPSWYYHPDGIPSHEDFEKLVGHDVERTVTFRKGEFTMDNTVLEMKDHSLVMKLLYKLVCLIFGMSIKDRKSAEYQMMIRSALDCSMSGMKQNAAIKADIFEGLVMMANGHRMKGFLKFFSTR